MPLGPVLPLRVGNWSLTSLQQRFWLLLVESHLTRRLFGAMVRRGPKGTPALPAPAG
ncbi:MAG: hypothetical protein AAB225_25825 [Acidobacteriota bacterium]